jgi:ATP-dependent DNA helicase RecG
MNLGAESETEEFKLSMSQMDKGIRSLTAMLNRHNYGTVYFGVDDNGNVVGLELGKDSLMELRNRIKNMVEPNIVCDISKCVSDDGKTYVKVSAKGSDIPYSCDGRFYLRNVSADESVSMMTLRKMLASGSSDLIVEMRSPRQDLTFKGLTVMLSSHGLHLADDERFHKNYNLVNESGEFNVMAEILSDQNPHALKVVCFAGTDKSSMSERREYSGKSMLICMAEVLDYMDSLNQMKVDLGSGQRKETPLFPFDAFREAWVNACLHNSWREGYPPAVYLFDDRITVTSYGGLPFELSEEDFFKGHSAPVNKGLLTVFFAAGYAEQTGHGVITILDKCGRDAFKISPNFLDVNIPFAFEPGYVQSRKAMERSVMTLTSNQKSVLDYLKEHPNATLQETSDSVAVSLGGVKKIVSVLKERGLLGKEGSKKDGKWVVIFSP